MWFPLVIFHLCNIVILILCVYSRCVSSELFTSIHELKNLYLAETDLVSDLQQLIQTEEQKLQRIRK